MNTTTQTGSATVGAVAKLAHVSVRTLHHYDQVGLLKPSERSAAGYRRYTAADLERLQQILLYRALGFGLKEIKGLMAGPNYDRRHALVAQRGLVAERARKLEAILGLIDKTLVSLQGGVSMSTEEMFEVFGDFDPAEYQAEVEERWGDTEAYRESTRRTKGYTKADWQRIKEEGEANLARMAALFDAGVASTDPRAMDVAEEARLVIDRTFYPCSRQMHVGLGEMYVADARFTEYYDRHRVGLATWFCQAIKANADRGSARP